MALSTQSGTVVKVTATAAAMLLKIEWDNPSPPPLKLDKTYEIPSGPIRQVVAALDPGEAVSVESDDAAPTMATAVSKP